MTENDSRRILDWIDSALELFRYHEGQLSAKEVRIRSLLSVARNELAETCIRRSSPRSSGGSLSGEE
jgi:hypothetical protein